MFGENTRQYSIFDCQSLGETAMKKSCLVMTAIFASVLAVNSSSLMAQTADVSAKN
jgi:hypothetical protein